jgi:hypothetical protein
LACLYQLLVLGTPSTQQIAEVEELISQSLQAFSLRLGEEVEWVINPATLEIKQQQSTAAVFFGGVNASQENLQNLLQRNIPILPVVSDVTKVQEEIPAVLRSLGCLPYATGGAQRVVTALLECVGLLPSQRRVFVSYRRDEARQTALQLFDELSSRLFDVFLDTHHITPSEDFQAMLWHRLCDSDVLIMLDTPNYFESRWTSAEFGRALAKGIAILRVGWPDVIPSRRTDTTSHIGLLAEDVDQTTGQLTDRAIDQICYQLEAVRSRGHAVRNLNLASHLRIAVEKIGGYVMGVGINKAMYLRLADGKDVVVYTTLSIPTSITLHHAARNSPNSSVAVVYDHVGLHPDWLEHLDWLGNQISVVRWVKATDAAWCFADWEV